MFPRASLERERRLLRSELQSAESPTTGFSQPLHQAVGFLLNAVLNAPLPHPEILQGCEGEAPGLLFLPGGEAETRREVLGKEEWANTWEAHRWTIPTHYQCWTCANTYLPSTLVALSSTGKLPLPENSSPTSIRASFTASYPCKTTMGFMPKYTVNTGL